MGLPTLASYLRGKASDYNAEFALDEAKFWQFLEATQADELAKLRHCQTSYII